MTAPWAVVGLGNPGAQYAGTRHNVGAMVVRRLADVDGTPLRASRKARCDTAEVHLGPHRVVLGVPHSFMNESGGPVSALVGYYGVPPEQLVVVHDEIDLPFGVLRVKLGGGDNGHNGLKSIRRSVGTGDWYRVRVGVGRGRGEAATHVLSRFSGAEKAELPDMLDTVAACVASLVERGLAPTQNEFNS